VGKHGLQDAVDIVAQVEAGEVAAFVRTKLPLLFALRGLLATIALLVGQLVDPEPLGPAEAVAPLPLTIERLGEAGFVVGLKRLQDFDRFVVG
jgi:hypothetical protein